MSKAASSPTARLLQHSRLFSLPRPLPPPGLEAPTSAGLYRASDTATSPYPTHQAIATPPSSHYRGDWGLKRALPAKATNSSTPHIRVRAQDNTEHITDFGSAADHTLTVRKWAEMGVPLLQRRNKAKGTREAPVSVFEGEMDNTASRGHASRWKFGGPWLAGMQEGEFQQFIGQLTVRRGVGGRKDAKGRSRVDDFREFVKDKLADERYADRRSEAREQGEVLSLAAIVQLRADLRPDDEELDTHFQTLRIRYPEEGLSSRLTLYICDFLDLPAVSLFGKDSRSTPNGAFISSLMDTFNLDGPDAESTPPSTHPSAGLSYLRTNAILDNHPLYGAQAHRTPVLARVLRPRNGAMGTEYQAKIGVAGVVTNDPVSSTFNSKADKAERADPNAAVADIADRNKYEPNKMSDALEPDLEGGNKMWVHPTSAYIDEKGRIRLEVSRGTDEAVAVKHNDVEHIHHSRWSTMTSTPSTGLSSRSYAAPPGTAQNANYGTSLPDTRRLSSQRSRGGEGRTPDYSTGFGQPGQGQPQSRRRPEIRGFEEELGAGGGRMGENEAMSRIRELGRGAGRR